MRVADLYACATRAIPRYMTWQLTHAGGLCGMDTGARVRGHVDDVIRTKVTLLQHNGEMLHHIGKKGRGSGCNPDPTYLHFTEKRKKAYFVVVE